MKNLSAITDNEDIVTKKYVLDKINFFNVEKVYYVGYSDSITPTPDPEPDPEPSGDPVDITNYLTSYGDYYINASGVPTVSVNANFCYKCDLSAYTPTSITAATRSVAWFTYAFYNSTDTFNESTLISGGHLPAASTSPASAKVATLTISDIPDGALTMLAVQYYTSTFSVKGVVNS